MKNMEEEEEEDEEEVEDPSEAEVEEDNHSTKLKLNVINFISLGTSNMIVPCGRRMQIMLKLRVRWNKRINSC